MDSKVRLDAILELARRYNYNADHSHQVECLAGTLFMELADYHKLDRTDRKLLEYSAILHDIGYAVSAKSHHRHALMMILTEPLIPFTRDEVKIIANVARYHRKALPTTQHTIYGSLSDLDKQRVAYMAAMLRVADALDRSHKARVEELTCEVTEESVVIHVIAGQELPEETAALARRGDLFQALFKKTPRLEVQLPRLSAPKDVFVTA